MTQSRMAASFAGVQATDDGNNNIAIRGNNPYGLLWRMEGIDIPNPNHFSAPATSGGGISILSTQLLANSDFMTGAFSAEYGNALSGVFDLRLRRGNNEKREYTLQAGFLGIDAAVEGPIKKGYDGSFLINYRYSTLSLLSNIGVNVGDGVTNFQDLSFNVYMPTKKAGTFSLFGFGGLSDQSFKAQEDSAKWEYPSDRERGKYISNTGMVGLKHQYIFNENHYLQNTIAASGTSISYVEDRLDDNLKFEQRYERNVCTNKITFNSVWNWKLNARHSIRTLT
ncbi:MAG: TonB-dependent receptor plug domain-containing protein [Flavobacteriales bacterium]